MNSQLDLDMEALKQVKDFLMHKNEELSLNMSNSLDSGLEKVEIAKYHVQESQHMGRRSINNLRYDFMGLGELSNPVQQGEVILSGFDLEEKEAMN